jgi:hypothetical protein
MLERAHIRYRGETPLTLIPTDMVKDRHRRIKELKLARGRVKAVGTEMGLTARL